LQAIWQAGLKVALVIFNQLQTDTPFVDAQNDYKTAFSRHFCR
jgi:dethiobiotin synthetase